MFKTSLLTILGSLLLAHSAIGQERSDWPENDSFSGTSVAYNPQIVPWVSWDALIYKAAYKTKVNEPGPLGLTEAQKKDLAWLHFRKRQEYEAQVVALDDDQAWLEHLKKAQPEERARLIEERKNIGNATQELDFEASKQFSRELVKGVFADLSNDQKRLATDLAAAELLSQVPVDRLFLQLEKSGYLELSKAERKEFFQDIREEAELAEQEIAKVRAKFWSRIVSKLPYDIKEKIESDLLIKEPSNKSD